MGFGFGPLQIQAAQKRQTIRGERICARCGGYIRGVTQGVAWFDIPRIPMKQGGKGADNCVIVCPKCFKELGQDGTKVIPYSDLP